MIRGILEELPLKQLTFSLRLKSIPTNKSFSSMTINVTCQTTQTTKNEQTTSRTFILTIQFYHIGTVLSWKLNMHFARSEKKRLTQLEEEKRTAAQLFYWKSSLPMERDLFLFLLEG